MHENHSLRDADLGAIRQLILEKRNRLQSKISRSHERRLKDLMEAVDSALNRIDGGRYGVCENCDAPIEADRLEEDPLARICIDCLSEEDRRVLERDLSLAARIQARLLPPTDFSFSGWEGHYEYQPYGVVSGDFCDVLPEKDHTLVLLGDVSGKGISAAMLMSHLIAVFRGLAGTGLSLPQLITRANRLFCASIPSGSFATLTAVRLEADGSIELCNAGHVPPVLQNGRIHQLPPDGIPLGLFSQTQFTTQRLQMTPGDRLVMVTDGLVESTNDNDFEFGLDSLTTILADHPSERPAAAASRLLDEAARHRTGRRAEDDTTVMVIRRSQ